MIALLRKLFAPKPERHYPRTTRHRNEQAFCACGYTSPWDYDLRKHFEQTGRIGK